MREDWIECKLGEILTVSSGKGLSASKMEAGKFPVYGGNGISGYHSDFLFEDIKLIIGRVGAKCGVVHITQPNSWVTDNALVVNFNFENPDLKFFKLLLEIENLNKLSNSTAQPVISGAKIYEYDILFPPLPEQRAIVKKLESLFSSLDAGVADLKKAQQQLKIYRQAVLKKAFEGELTKEWRNIEEKNFAVEVILNQIEEEREKFYYSQVKDWNQSVKDWENSGKEGKKNDKPTFNKIKIDATEKLLSGSYIHFGSICNVVRGGSPRPAGDPEFYDGNIPFLKVADLTRISSKFVTEYAYTIKPAGLQKTRFLKKGTLVISNSGATLGVARILGIDATANDGIAAFLDLHPEMTEFYYYYLNSQTKNLRAIDQGAGQPNLNTDLLKELLVPIFSIEEQHQIVKQIESRLSVCDSIEQNIKESLEKAEALRQSILKKAFEGSLLTAQELAECKQAVDYEPASVLLERIKSGQNKTTAKPSKKKVAQPVIVATIETPVAKISADIHAGLIAKVIKIHEENPASIDNLSHIKCEKIAHLVEYHLQIPLGRQPVKDAAGPDDYPHLKKIEHRAKMANYFAIQKKDIGYSYSSAKNSDKAIEKFQSALSDEKNKQLDDLIALFLKFDLEVSEIIATTYAGWNNLILNGNANPSDEEIVYESRENWSERKLKITRERFFKAIEWMRKNEIVPTGYGAVVPFPKKKK